MAWTPPKTLRALSPSTAAQLRAAVVRGHSLALRVKLALQAGVPSTQALSMNDRRFLAAVARKLYTYLPSSAVPLATAQTWLDESSAPGTKPRLEHAHRLGWPTFSDEGLLLRALQARVPGLRVPRQLAAGATSQTYLESIPEEVAAYRKDRLALWDYIRANYNKYLEDAQAHGAEISAALAAAGKHVRGDIRLFIYDIIVHVPAADVVPFLTSAPQGWGIESELLLAEGALVPNLINKALPKLQWVESQNTINKAQAENDAFWRSAAESSFQTLGAAVEGGGELLKSAAETAFTVAKDVGKGAGALLSKAGTALTYLPIGLGLVAVAGGGIYLATRKKDDVRRSTAA